MSKPSKPIIIFIVVIVSILALCSCTPGNKVVPGVRRWHDDEKNVTCWIYSEGYRGGISCIPDHQLQ